MRVVFTLLTLLISLYAFEESPFSQEEDPSANELYISYHNKPSKLYKNQVFKITIKALTTVKEYQDIYYKFIDGKNVVLLNQNPIREKKELYYLDTFYFQATATEVQTPTIDVSLVFKDYLGAINKTIEPLTYTAISLNPNKDFSNLLADSFKINAYNATDYNDLYNILVFNVTATSTNLKNFSLQNVHKQGFEKIQRAYPTSTMTYYAFISKDFKEFRFTYFNNLSSKFESINLPINVKVDRVSTQSDLAPKQGGKQLFALSMSGALLLFFVLLFIFRRKLVYLLLALLPLAYLVYLNIPIQKVCIQKGSSIYLLPMRQSTIFEQTKQRVELNKLGKIEGYYKVQLTNQKIGWISEQNICKN